MLKGNHINLRTMRQRDLESYLDLSSDIEARGPHYPLMLHTETALRQKYEKDGFWSEDTGLLLIVDKINDRILGSIVHFKPVHYHNSVEIGYIVFDTNDRGRGICSEALTLFTRYLFELKPIHRIQLQIQPGNVASRRVAEKCGFKFEGTARHALLVSGEPADINVFSLLRSELPQS